HSAISRWSSMSTVLKWVGRPERAQSSRNGAAPADEVRWSIASNPRRHPENPSKVNHTNPTRQRGGVMVPPRWRVGLVSCVRERRAIRKSGRQLGERRYSLVERLRRGSPRLPVTLESPRKLFRPILEKELPEVLRLLLQLDPAAVDQGQQQLQRGLVAEAVRIVGQHLAPHGQVV